MISKLLIEKCGLPFYIKTKSKKIEDIQSSELIAFCFLTSDQIVFVVINCDLPMFFINSVFLLFPTILGGV